MNDIHNYKNGNTLFLTKELLYRLYNDGNSLPQMAKELNCSIHKVVYWMQKYNIPRRSTSESVYLQANPTGDPFNIVTPITFEQSVLYGFGIGLYWGEGEKTSRGQVRVINTDPNLILTFRSFLLRICSVIPERIRYDIICFNDTSPEIALEYWTEKLGVSKEKFGKIVQIPPQGKGTYKRKSQFGVCTIRFSSTKLKKWIMGEIARGKVYADIV